MLMKSSGGPAKTGYYWDSETKQLRIDKEQKNTLIHIFDLIAKQNLSPHSIAQLLNKTPDQYKSAQGRPWTYKAISYLVTPDRIDFYSGYKDGKLGNWEPIIDTKTASLLKSRNIVTKTGPRPRKIKYLLTGIDLTTCGYCGGHIKSATYAGTKSENAYYYCSTRSVYGQSHCKDSRTIIQQSVDANIYKSIASQIRNIANIKKWTAELYEKRAKELSLRIRQIDKKIASNFKTQSKAISATELANINGQMNKLLETRQQLLNEKLDYYDFKNLLLARDLEKKNIETQKELLLLVIKKIILFRDKTIVEYPFVVTASGKQQIELEN